MDLRDLVVLAGIVNPEMLNKLEPTAEVEEADGAGFEDATTRPEETMMDDPMATMGSDVDTSLRRYLKAKGDHVTVDEEVYPDYTVEDVTESYAAFKEGKDKKDPKRLSESEFDGHDIMSEDPPNGIDFDYANLPKVNWEQYSEEDIKTFYSIVDNLSFESGYYNDGEFNDSHFNALRWLEKNVMNKSKGDEDDVEEGNAYSGALAKAKAAGADEFEVDGKVHKVKEGAKPDFADIDGDGDKEESMKKAAKDKEEDEEVDESLDILKKLAGL